MNEGNTLVERINSWIKSSITLKLITITILGAVLLIPSAMIKSIISEREYLNREATGEVSSKWANSQTVNGPVLTVPLLYGQTVDNKRVEFTRYAHILPDELNIDGSIDPTKLSRGIYEIVVYRSSLTFAGKFKLREDFDKKDLAKIKWDEAFLTIGISDLRGIEDEVEIIWNGERLPVQPGSAIQDIIYSGITVPLPDLHEATGGKLNFKFDLHLQGSRNLSFVPIGSTTNITLASTWDSPSFNGNFLPDERTLNDDGFTAHWKVLQLNRNFPQVWKNAAYKDIMNASAFGVDLKLPMDDYQKSMRSAKYAIMTIALTFLIFFLVEVRNGKKIHPLQYTLVGLALCLFYVLLISISEHSNFNTAYAISTVAIVSMISMYSISVFKAGRLTSLLFTTLVAVYGFLFVTLQLADYALLMGSAGLTLILAATMYFTRNINWYKPEY